MRNMNRNAVYSEDEEDDVSNSKAENRAEDIKGFEDSHSSIRDDQIAEEMDEQDEFSNSIIEDEEMSDDDSRKKGRKKI